MKCVKNSYYIIYSMYYSISVFWCPGTIGDNMGTSHLCGYGHRTLKTCDGFWWQILGFLRFRGFYADAGWGMVWVAKDSFLSRDNWVYPCQRTPMGNPYIGPITRGYLWVSYPQESQGCSHNFHTVVVRTRTWVNGGPHPSGCPLIPGDSIHDLLVTNNQPLSWRFDPVTFE